MITRIAVALIALVLIHSPAAGQIIKVPESSGSAVPIYASAEVGFLSSQGRFDPASGTYWRLGQGLQFRGSIAAGFRTGAFGLAVSQASLPVGRSPVGAPAINGDVDLRMFLATFRTNETRSVHQILEVSTGLAQWTNLTAPAGQALATDDDDRNAWVFLIGYGFGIPLGSSASITIMQDMGTVVGTGSGVTAGQSRITRQYTTRLGLRVKLSGQR